MTKKILLMVEDDVAIAKLFRANFRDEGISVVVKATANEAVDFLLECRKADRNVDLVVLDLWLPHEKGNRKIEQNAGDTVLRSTSYVHLLDASCPVIVFTNNPSYDNCAECIKAGAYAYIPKVELNQENLGKLVSLCRYLLLLDNQKSERDKWVERNAAAVREQNPGKVLGVFEVGAARRAGRKEQEVEGFLVIPCASVEELASLMIHDRKLRWEPFFYIDARRPSYHVTF